MTEPEILWAFAAIVVLILTAAFAFLLRAERSRTRTLAGHSERLEMELASLQTTYTEEKKEWLPYRDKYLTLLADHRNLRERFEEHRRERLKDEERFEFIAARILEEKTVKFDLQHRKGIKEILEPFKEKIRHFESKIESTNKESIERHSSLREQIRSLTQLNEKMTQEAVNLTNALKSDTKKQGNWGEMILESILEKSGLEKDREYFIQKSIINDEGKKYQPDVLIALPGKKKLIIDSKVSLVDYERCVNAPTEEEGHVALKAHVRSVKKHIETLSMKRYHDLYKIESPDFVLMFVPIETAFSSALSGDAGLYQYAFDRNIVIVTPSTLLATLKTVDTMWQNEKQNKYAFEIAVEAGKMYDKFSGFINDLEKMGRQLQTVTGTYNDSLKKMVNGSGNLIRRAQKIRKLGAKVSKTLPEKLTEISS